MRVLWIAAVTHVLWAHICAYFHFMRELCLGPCFTYENLFSIFITIHCALCYFLTLCYCCCCAYSIYRVHVGFSESVEDIRLVAACTSKPSRMKRAIICTNRCYFLVNLFLNVYIFLQHATAYDYYMRVSECVNVVYSRWCIHTTVWIKAAIYPNSSHIIIPSFILLLHSSIYRGKPSSLGAYHTHGRIPMFLFP